MFHLWNCGRKWVKCAVQFRHFFNIKALFVVIIFEAWHLFRMSLGSSGGRSVCLWRCRLLTLSVPSGEQASGRRWDCSGLGPRGPKVLRHQMVQWFTTGAWSTGHGPEMVTSAMRMTRFGQWVNLICMWMTCQNRRRSQNTFVHQCQYCTRLCNWSICICHKCQRPLCSLPIISFWNCLNPRKWLSNAPEPKLMHLLPSMA